MATNPANDVLVRAVMECESGLPEDRIVNDFAFHYDGGILDASLPDLLTWVNDFYRVAPAGTPVGQYISDYVNRSATHELQAYRIHADGSLDSPVLTEAWLGPPAAGTDAGLPAEVAAVLSFHADLTGVLEEVGATRPRARRRGRIYIGPLITGTIDTTTPPYMLNAAFLTQLRAAANRLIDDSSSLWSVWSRRDAILRPVVGGWTDNAPDTQRRRGPAASTRVTFG